MATKITITADGNQAKAEIGSVAASLDGMGNQASQAAAETEAAGERMEDVLEEVQSEARQTSNALEGMSGANVLRGITAASTSFLAMGQALKGVGQLSRDALQGINTLAEQGNPAATKLKASFDGLLTSLQNLAMDPALQDFGDQLAELTRRASLHLQELPDVFRSTVADWQQQIAAIGEQLGLLDEGAVGRLKFLEEFYTKQRNAQKEQIAAEKGRLLELEKQKKAAEEAAKAEKEAADQQSQAELEAFQDSERMAAEAFDKENERIVALTKQREESHKQELELERRAIEEKERLRQEDVERAKGGLKGTGATEGINRAAMDPQAIAKRLADQAAESAMSDMYKAGADVDDPVNRKAIEDARRAAHRAAIMQSRGGKETFSRDQITDAINQNATAGVQAMGEAGNFSSTALQALSESAAEQRRMAEEMRAMQEQLAELRRFQQGTTQDGQRRRSQRNSSRQ